MKRLSVPGAPTVAHTAAANPRKSQAQTRETRSRFSRNPWTAAATKSHRSSIYGNFTKVLRLNSTVTCCCSQKSHRVALSAPAQEGPGSSVLGSSACLALSWKSSRWVVSSRGPQWLHYKLGTWLLHVFFFVWVFFPPSFVPT